MLLIILGSLLLSQVFISLWKKYHIRSYNISTLLGLWLVPMFMSFQSGYTRFLIVWALFSIVNGFIVRRALESPMRSSTPRLVYWWFQKVYDASYFLGACGYVVMLLAFFHIPMIFGSSVDGEADIFMVFGVK
jgi:RING finger protein 121/175